MTLSLIPFRLSVLRVCQGSCNGVLRGRFREVTWMFLSQRAKGVSRRFLGCFNEVSRTFQDSLKGVSQKLPRCFKKISRMCQERSVKGVSRKFQGCYKEVLRVFQQTLNVISIFKLRSNFYKHRCVCVCESVNLCVPNFSNDDWLRQQFLAVVLATSPGP